MKPIKQTLLSGAIILALSLVLTSCEDILGEWSRPTPVTPEPTPTPEPKTAGTISYVETNYLKGSLDPAFTNPLTLTGDGAVSYESTNTAVATVDATGKVTIVGVGSATIKAKTSDTDATTYATSEATYTLEVQEGYSYLKWDDTAKKLVSAIETNYQEVSSFTTTWDGTKVLVVKDPDVTIASDITLSGNTAIILCDGSKLTVNGNIINNTQDLTIYAQSEGEGMGLMNVTKNADDAIRVKNLSIHGGKFSAEVTGNVSKNDIFVSTSINIYGGNITVQGASYDANARVTFAAPSTTITGKAKVTAKGGKSTNGMGGEGIGYGVYSTISISGDAEVTAIGGEGGNCGGHGILGVLSVSGHAKVIAIGGDNKGVGSLLNTSYGITSSSTITISGDAEVTAIGGNTLSGNLNGGAACNGNVVYQGGKFCFVGGTPSGTGSNGKAISGTLTNTSGASAFFQWSTDGSDWTDLSLTASSPGNTNNTEVTNRYLRTK